MSEFFVPTTHFPQESFPAAAAFRSFNLGHISRRVARTVVANLLFDVGITQGNFRLYWDMRAPDTTRGFHRGYC